MPLYRALINSAMRCHIPLPSYPPPFATSTLLYSIDSEIAQASLRQVQSADVALWASPLSNLAPCVSHAHEHKHTHTHRAFLIWVASSRPAAFCILHQNFSFRRRWHIKHKGTLRI